MCGLELKILFKSQKIYVIYLYVLMSIIFFNAWEPVWTVALTHEQPACVRACVRACVCLVIPKYMEMISKQQFL